MSSVIKSGKEFNSKSRLSCSVIQLSEVKSMDRNGRTFAHFVNDLIIRNLSPPLHHTQRFLLG